MADPVPRLPDWVQPGVSFRQSVGQERWLYHVRALVDGHAIIRRWIEGRWNYRCEGWEYFNAFGPSIHVVKIKNSRK